MARIINTKDLGRLRLNTEQKLWVYNGLDVCNTFEVADVMREKVEADPYFNHVYNLTRAFYAPVMDIQTHGIAVDHERREEHIAALKEELFLLSGRKFNEKTGKWYLADKSALFPALVGALTGEPFAHSQVKKVAWALYDCLNIDKVYDPKKKRYTPSTSDETLEKLGKKYKFARPLVELLQYIRSGYKDLEALETQFDPDGRMRFGISITGTETGRWSSKKNIFKRANNGQNIAKKLRDVYIPDPGYTIGYCDLASAESYGVGYITGDENYIETFHREDIHTFVANAVYGVPKDRKWCEKNYIREGKTYRAISKNNGHGANYMRTYRALARKEGLPEAQAFRFEAMYKGAECSYEQAMKWELWDIPHRIEGEIVYYDGLFPKIREWPERTKEELIENDGYIVTPMGRKRHFDDDPHDLATLRQAVAYQPQSTIVDILNVGLWRVWYHLSGEGLKLLLQIHDAILIQVPTGTEEYFEQRIRELMEIPVNVNGRTMTIPIDVSWGGDGTNNWKGVS